MTLKIDLPDRLAAELELRAAGLGLSLQDWLVQLAGNERSRPQTQSDAQAAVANILELQKRIKPDPEGLTPRDYINYGRR
jgi:hypothetical protein